VKFGQLLIIGMCLAVVGVSPAFAQGAAPRRPSGGLFGATRSDVGGRDKLNFTFQLAAALDSALPPDVNSRVSRGLDSGGLSTVFQASSDYAHTGRRLQLMGGVSTAFKYYERLDRLDAVSHTAALGASVRLPHGTLRLDQVAAYARTYLYQLFPTDSSPELSGSIPANPEYQIEETDSYWYSTKAALAFGSARGTQVTASGGLSRTDFSQELMTRSDLEIYNGGVKISRRVAPSGSFVVGYDFRTGEFGFGGATTEHRVTLGVEYAPALSRTRRATLRLDLTPTQVNLPESALFEADGDTVDPRLLRLSGEASVSYPFRPNWRAAARYRRSVEYFSVINQPVLADGGRVELRGLLARRVDLAASGGYIRAASAFNRFTQPLETYTGQVAIRYALKRSLALSSEYLYHYYDLREQAGFAPDLPAIFERHGVRVGVVLFIETLGR
jgi:hypothetical protein